jgi:hypothetical protein
MLRRCREPFPGCPVQRLLRYRRRPVPGSPRDCIFRHQLMNLPSCPGSFTLRFRQRELSGHPASSLASDSSDGPGTSSPWRFGPSVVPRNGFPVRPGSLFFSLAAGASSGCPDSASTAGSMMNPVCLRTLHPRLAPRMNLRFQSGFAVLPEERRCFNFSRVFAIGKPTANSRCPLTLHRCPTRTAVQLPTGSPTERDCAPTRSVEASVKLKLICGYHHARCIRMRVLHLDAKYA